MKNKRMNTGLFRSIIISSYYWTALDKSFPQYIHLRTFIPCTNPHCKLAPAAAHPFDSKASPLNSLNWKLIETDTSNEARFQAILKDAHTYIPKFIKIFRIQTGSYDLNCDIAAENLSGKTVELKQTPVGYELSVPEKDRAPIATVIKLTVDKPAATIEPMDMGTVTG